MPNFGHVIIVDSIRGYRRVGCRATEVRWVAMYDSGTILTVVLAIPGFLSVPCLSHKNFWFLKKHEASYVVRITVLPNPIFSFYKRGHWHLLNNCLRAVRLFLSFISLMIKALIFKFCTVICHFWTFLKLRISRLSPGCDICDSKLAPIWLSAVCSFCGPSPHPHEQCGTFVPCQSKKNFVISPREHQYGQTQ